MSTENDDALIPVTRVQKPRGGQLYQGVCATIRALIKDEVIDKRVDAGSISQARSIAASIDRLEDAKASGMQLAPMHEQLGKVLERLNPAGTSDPFQEFLDDLDKESSPDGSATAPHPEV